MPSISRSSERLSDGVDGPPGSGRAADVPVLGRPRRTDIDAIVEELLAFREELRRSGRSLASSPFQPVAFALTIRVRNSKMPIIDGPFAEAPEELGEFYVIEATDPHDAIRVTEDAASLDRRHRGAPEKWVRTVLVI